jgi:uncharacterized damage-inducible protein DinB
MNVAEFIEQSLDENKGYVEMAIKGLTKDELAWRVKPHSNSIIFLMWHLARVEDLWINRILLAGKEIYETAGWHKKFGTPANDSGFGYDVKKLDAWPVPELELVRFYSNDIRARTLVYLKDLNEKKLDEPKDFGWRKGTAGSALSHLVSEVGEHTGQIGYIHGIIKGIENPPPPPPKK